MDYSSFMDLNSLSEEARKELESFYEYLVFKSKKKTSRKNNKESKKEQFMRFADKHLIELPDDYKFNREEANER